MDGPATPDADDPEAAEHIARARVGRALRDLGHSVVGHHAPLDLLQRVAVTLETLDSEVESGPVRSRDVVSFGQQFTVPFDGTELASYGDRPVSGACSPWGVDLSIRRRGREVVAEVVLRAAHEGAPGRSHGGVVAAIFDDLMGFVLQIEGIAAYTGEISVRYEAPVPLHVPLVWRAWLREQVGRKLHIDATCHDGQTLVARSWAVFIAVPSFAPAD